MWDSLTRKDAGFTSALALALLLASLVLAVEASTEPMHIDELRQVRSYPLPVSQIVERSFQQQQPPLDPVLNAVLQRVVGEGDFRQRALSVLLGVASIGLLGTLMLRSRLRLGAVAATAYLAISPLLVSVFAYARPYALPMFLMLSFLVAVDRFLEHGGHWRAGTIGLLALLLPASRTTEPPLLLGVSFVAMLIVRRHSSQPRSKRTALVMAICAGSILFVALPILVAVSRYGLAQYTAEGFPLANLTRLFSDLPEALTSSIPLWWIVPVGIIVVSRSAVRRSVTRRWWVWCLAALPFLFAGLFFARAEPGQPYYDRYAFTFVPLIAVLVGLFSEAFRDRSLPRPTRWVAASVALALLASGVSGTARTMATEQNADWAEAAKNIRTSVPSDGTILLDRPAPWGTYRTAFAGQPRYLSRDWVVPSVPVVLSRPSIIEDSSPIAVLLMDAIPEVPGWRQVYVDETFRLYLPAGEYPKGPSGAVDTYLLFGDALGPANGSGMYLAAAALSMELDRLGQAKRIVADLLKDVQGPQKQLIVQELRRLGVPA